MKNCKEINPECIDCKETEKCFIFRRAYKEHQKVLIDAVRHQSSCGLFKAPFR